MSVRDAAVIAKLMLDAVAEPKVPPALIEAPIVHVPALTKTTIPVEDPTVHTPGVVDVMVGAVASAA